MASMAPASIVRQTDLPRQMMPVLIPRKLVENYQLAGSFHLMQHLL